MKADYIREALHAAPFRPFTLHIADGKSVHVPHADFIAVLASHRPLKFNLLKPHK
jgi:hypothetical protein